MSAAPADQAPSADHHEDISLDWLNMDGHPSVDSNGDVRMSSPIQEAQQMPMDVVQQAQTLLEPPPPAGPPQTEGVQQSDQSAVGALQASADQTSSMQTDEQPTQESLNPSPEVIQQCIDENFVELESGYGPAEGAPSSGSRVCRMCQYVLHPLFHTPPHRYSRPVAGFASSGPSRTRRRRRSRLTRARRSSRGTASRSTPRAGSCCSRDVWKTTSLMRMNRRVLNCKRDAMRCEPDSDFGVVCGVGACLCATEYPVQWSFGGVGSTEL